jgi:hypothetical protein
MLFLLVLSNYKTPYGFYILIIIIFYDLIFHKYYLKKFFTFQVALALNPLNTTALSLLPVLKMNMTDAVVRKCKNVSVLIDKKMRERRIEHEKIH